ncbi:competence protein CoiA [Gracilibacillus timonensis]|uniref:competence protein CoiA n=1 Tax=Gracilibacillus timonensis TaxID=1816696 RepID=UPI000824B8D3|nr:competence protein CoiA family protein [Gracilibacillus timonensis]
MLQAVNQKGEVVVVWNANRKKLQQMRKETFYCPACQQPLLLRAGTKNIAHFAHKGEAHCDLSGESLYHETGKRDIYVWLKNQGYQVFLEYYVEEIKQRADILLHLADKRIAIEYQCARISSEEILDRTAGYRSVNIIPIWILGGNRMRRLSANSLRITTTEHAFLYQFHPNYPLSIYYYCSNTKQMIQYQDVIFLTKTQTFGALKAQKLFELTWRDLFHPHYRAAQAFRDFWQKKKKTWIHHPVSVHHQQETMWRQWLYLHQLQLATLPHFVYLPIVSQYRMKVPPWIWQSRLYVDLLRKNRSVSLSEARHFMYEYYISPRKFPFIKEDVDPIKEYFQLLIKYSVLQPIKQEQYLINHSTV